MRLPIYRRLDEGLRILGLSLKELVLLGVIFIGFGHLLSFWKWGRVLALVLSVLAFFVIRILDQKFESHFLSKFLRFASLPKGLGKGFFKNICQEKATNEDLLKG